MDMNIERLHGKCIVEVLLLVIATYVAVTCMQMIYIVDMYALTLG